MDVEISKNLVSNLKQLMAITELNSQVKLAKAAEVSQTNLSSILRGNTHPQLDTVEKLAGAFGLKSWQLLGPDMPIVMNGQRNT